MTDETKDLQTIPQELTVDQVVEQVNKVKALMTKVMREGEHYGTISGVKHPSLYKPGAEQLSVLFRLRPEYETQIEYFGEGDIHREYRITCRLFHIVTGKPMGEGIGSCSTMESKFRYRKAEEIIGQVPPNYWDVRKANPEQARQMIGKGNHTKKIDGTWFIVSATGERIENPDIADVYNTCWKMACKRAHVAAMLTACAASDIFTQDLEDFQGQPTEQTVTATVEKEEPKKRGRMSKEELIDRIKKGNQIMLDEGIIEKDEFAAVNKYLFEIADDYTKLKECYKNVSDKYRKGMATKEEAEKQAPDKVEPEEIF